MNRQNASRKMFGLIMLAITLLLVACGTEEGDATPTATSGANEAVPTLPVDDATASAETADISEEDIAVLDSDVPATAEEVEATAEAEMPVDLTGTASTPVGETSTPATAAVVEGTPTIVEATPPGDATIAGDDVVPLVGTPAANVEAATALADATADTDTGDSSPAGTFDTPGDGTGGSGQPGERSSNIPGEETLAASPVALLTVEGCEVPDVSGFTGTSTAYVTSAEVNFRFGPGTDCPAILADPLGEGVAITVLGGPVTQGADDSSWLQVEVDGVPGWVTTEFVEPAD